jgi:hypothetical protein
MVENEPIDYAQMVILGTLQEYLDMVDDTVHEQQRDYATYLTNRFPKNIAEDIAREMMMYGN